MRRMKTIDRPHIGKRVRPDLKEFAEELTERAQELVPHGRLHAGFGVELALNAIRYWLDRAPKNERVSLEELLELPFDED